MNTWETDNYYDNFTVKRRYTNMNDIKKRIAVLDHGKSVKNDLDKVTNEIANLSDQYKDIKELLIKTVETHQITKDEEKMKIYDASMENQRGKQMGKASKQQYEEYLKHLRAKQKKKPADQWNKSSARKLDSKGKPI